MFCFFSVKSASDLTSQNAQNRGSISPSSHIIFTRVQPSLPTFNSAVLQLFIAPKAPTHRCGKSGYKLVTEFDSYSDDGVSAVTVTVIVTVTVTVTVHVVTVVL